MKIAVIGGGGREHAIIRALAESPKTEIIYALPGNGGIAQDAVCVPIGAMDLDRIVDFALDKSIDFAVVAPDDPLAAGLVDMLTEHGISCFGPNKAAAMIESSKAFAKSLMKKYNIPTAAYEVFDDLTAAREYVRKQSYPLVIKADGLALGKGVIIAETQSDADEALIAMMQDGRFGDSGSRVVIEEFLTGPEVTVLSFCDGETIVPMVSSMDHKRAFAGDLGPNTGGMGVIAPNPFYTPEQAKRAMNEIFLPTLRAMQSEGRPFKGCLYFGLMLTADGPKVIEYNCRFGDPEAQAVLPLLHTDLLEIMLAVSEERLDKLDIVFSHRHSCCLIVASGGYPGAYAKDKKIEVGDINSARLYHAGTRLGEENEFYTAGGRVLGLTCVAESLSEAVNACYQAVCGISFEDMYFRPDIGQVALLRGKR